MPVKPSIGHVGVGLMGTPMVKRLLSLGYRVRGFDIVSGKAAAAGADPVASAADAAKGAELVLLNLPTTEAVEEAVFGAAGLAGALRPPQLLIDFSTIKVDRCVAFARRLREASGCGWIDAPVSGGPPASGTGTLVLAEAAGIDAARLPECLAGGHADGSLLQKLYPRMQQRDFAPLGYARQLLKDLEMVHQFAAAAGTPTPMMGEALRLYRELVRMGHAELGGGAVLKAYEFTGR